MCGFEFPVDPIYHLAWWRRWLLQLRYGEDMGQR